MYSVDYGNKEIKFNLTRKDVKNINLNIKPDMSVNISASEEVPLNDIKDFVKEKGNWIFDSINYFEKNQPEEKIRRRYVSGETFRYLGKQHRIKVYKSEDNYVKYFRGFIHIYVDEVKNRDKKKELLDLWYEERMDVVFNESLSKMHKKVNHHGIGKPELNSRKMSKRWGSCLVSKNIIILNKDLIKAPKYCIDYVVLHELIHFKYRNHSDGFYNFLSVLMPDWKERKKILDEFVIREL